MRCEERILSSEGAAWRSVSAASLEVLSARLGGTDLVGGNLSHSVMILLHSSA